ncbi:CGNR zinc finger domain-containing protein [Streptomyces sp. NPDC048638]|uniref:CGNR zinc finger domain-containing protein n=1 Tax=Streptomyces sp. NPDC048638 TaxID=3365580 RepID=UPI003720C377
MGAGVATDLVNTSPRVRSSGDVLPDPAALAAFLTDHDLHPDALADERRPTQRDLEQVHTLRQEVHAVLETTDEQDVVDAAAALVSRAGTGPSLFRDDEGRWQWFVAARPDAPLADELAVLMGVGLLGTVRTLSHDRFRHCTAEGCQGVFVDTSKAGRRRYCMPEVCGNRRNVANYRARRTRSGTGAP